MAYGALLIATIIALGLGWREAPKMSTEGKGGLLGTLPSASLYSVITRQSPSDIAWFISFAEVSGVLVTLGHPKRLLPHDFLDFGEDDALRSHHEGQEKAYGWAFGVIVASVIAYVIFTSPTPFD